MTFLTILDFTEILWSFRSVLQGKTGKEIPESSRLEYLEKFSTNDFALSDAEDNSSGTLNRGSIADLLLLSTLLLRQKSREPSYWKVMYSFLLVGYATLAASRTLLQWLLILTLKKKLCGPFLWMGFNCLKARATSRRQFTFYH